MSKKQESVRQNIIREVRKREEKERLRKSKGTAENIFVRGGCSKFKR